MAPVGAKVMSNSHDVLIQKLYALSSLDWVSTLLTVSAHSTYSRDSFLFLSFLCNMYLNYLDYTFNDPCLWIDH